MAGKNRIVVKIAKNKEKYALVKSANNQTVAQTETYRSEQGVQNAIKALKKIVKNAVVVDNTKKKK